MEKVKQFYKKVSSIGLDNSFSNIERKQIKLVNIYALISMHTTALFYIGDLIEGEVSNTLNLSVFFAYVIAFLILFLNKKKMYNYAKIVWVLFLFAFINFSCLLIHKGEYHEFFFILISGTC